MKPFGNRRLIEAAISRVKNLSASFREIDGLIALAVFSEPTNDAGYRYLDSMFPYAMIMKSRRTSDLFKDLIEFENPTGSGFVLMNAEKVPHFTTRLDDGLKLFDAQTKWSIGFTGLVKCEHHGYEVKKFHDRLRTPQLGICSVGLQLQLSFCYQSEIDNQLIA